MEKDASCKELSNRILTLGYGSDGTQTINGTMINWRNIAPCGNYDSLVVNTLAAPEVHLGQPFLYGKLLLFPPSSVPIIEAGFFMEHLSL